MVLYGVEEAWEVAGAVAGAGGPVTGAVRAEAITEAEDVPLAVTAGLARPC